MAAEQPAHLAGSALDAEDDLGRVLVGGDGQVREQLGRREPLGLGFVEQFERTLAGEVGARAGPGAAMPQALVRYSPVRVSTLMRSPGLTNSGTWTTSPVSKVVGCGHPRRGRPAGPDRSRRR